MERTEFGARRSSCSCPECVRYCHYVPGALIPSDLDRMTKGVTDVRAWAEKNLLASPGTLMKDTATGWIYRIRTLVPAVKPDGSCIHLTAEDRCGIHEVAPFGCAFFDCGPAPEGIGLKGLLACRDFFESGMYGLLWRYLWKNGKRQVAPEELRKRMKEEK